MKNHSISRHCDAPTCLTGGTVALKSLLAVLLLIAGVSLAAPEAAAHNDGTCHSHDDNTCHDYGKPRPYPKKKLKVIILDEPASANKLRRFKMRPAKPARTLRLKKRRYR